MNRTEIKHEAIDLVKNNFKDVWKGLIINFVISLLYSVVVNYFFKDLESPFYIIFSSIFNLVTIPITFGTTKYILSLIRNEKHSIKDIFYFYKHHIIESIILSILLSLCLSVGMILFFVPAIIFALMFSMSENIFVDGTTNAVEALKKSADLMKGYKWDYLNFVISFLGWFILGVITLGLAFIWVIPYFMIAQKIYYEKLNQVKK